MDSVKSGKQNTKLVKTECNFCKNRTNLKPNCVSEIKKNDLEKKAKLASLEGSKNQVGETQIE